MMINEHAIGIFDSGIGGLSIARQIHQRLPNEHLLYVADSIHAPYGEKSAEYITQRAFAISEFLIKRNVKAIVVACNTATVSSIKALRAQYSLPIIGVEPGVKPAVFNTKTGIVGVLATAQTLKSVSFNDLAKAFSTNVKIEVQPCPGLMEQVETLSLDSVQTEVLVKQYVYPLLEKGADHIVLGCTHYAFLALMIKRIVGPNIEIINTDFAVAKETARRLETANLLSSNNKQGDVEFWSSGIPSVAQRQFSQLWGEPVNVFKM
jgi:glutamate racemase